ncbi:MAG: hypothetical protein WC003_17275 [Terrimicrobiaceae bacterium]
MLLETEEYNCVAWSLEDQERWWQPFPNEYQYWPKNAPEAYSVDAFKEMFILTAGFEECDSSDLEYGYEKIAIYGQKAEFTHVARQLADGRWASKLGDWEDIEYNTLKALVSDQYGMVKFILRRRRND